MSHLFDYVCSIGIVSTLAVMDSWNELFELCFHQPFFSELYITWLLERTSVSNRMLTSTAGVNTYHEIVKGGFNVTNRLLP
jgi:hypothetical protein